MGNKKSFHEMFAGMSRAINGALNSEQIMQNLTNYGYTDERIRTEGLNTLTEVEQLFDEHRREYGEQYDAYRQVEKAFGEAYAYYMPKLRLARIALKNLSGALHSIKATGSRSRSITGFTKESKQFYNNLLAQPEHLAAMEKFNVKKADLEKGLEMVSELEKAYQAYLIEKGEAQDATIRRDKAFDALYDWYSEFRAVARIAMSEHPQLLEQMGIVIKS